MKVLGPFPFEGEVIWLTPEQGGRRGGPPPDPEGYASIAHVPPGTAAQDSASFVLRGWDPAAWRSTADARWLVGEEHHSLGVSPPDVGVEPGTVIAVTEGPRLVAYFTVKAILPPGRADPA